MNALLDFAEPWLQAVVTLSWKGTLLAVAVALVILCLRKRLSPAWRHGLWLLVLLRFVLPDLGTSSWSMQRLSERPVPLVVATIEPTFEPTSEPVAVPLEFAAEALVLKNPAPLSQTVPLEYSPTRPPASSAWTPMQGLTLTWLLGMTLVLATMGFLHGRLVWKLRRNSSLPSAPLSAALQNACHLAGVRQAPRLIVSDAVRAPALFGVLHPAILLPREIASTHDSASLRLILLHELAHMQRRDLWSQIIASLIVAVQWFNPMVWWAAQRMRTEAEMASDARALRSTDLAEAHRLGEVLLGFANRATSGWMVWFAAATLLGISANPSDLRHRIEALIDIARGRRTRWIVGLAAFSLLAVFGLTKAPAQVAEAPPKAPEPATDSANTIVVSGVVVNATGQPVNDAKVRLSVNLISTPYQQQELQSGPDGRFQFKPAPKAASLNITVRHPDYAESKPLSFKGYSPNEERRVVLPDISWVVGKITHKHNGQPIKNVRVFFGVEQNPIYQSPYRWIYPTVRTSETGEYRLPVATRNAEKIILRAWHPGMTSHAAPLNLSGPETSHDAQLESAVSLAGQVIDSEEIAVEDAFVWVAEDALTMDAINYPITAEFLKSNQRSRLSVAKVQFLQAYSDAEGGFKLDAADPLLKPHFWVIAIHPERGIAKMNAQDFQSGSKIKLEPWASLSGILLDPKGNPLPNISGTIWASFARDYQNPQPESFRGSHTTALKTDAEGRFQIDHLLPGSSFSAVTIDREYRPIERITVSSGPQPSHRIQIAESRRLAEAGLTRSIEGRIILPEGYSFRSEDYSLNLSITSNGRVLSGGSPQPDPDGRFMTAPLPLGDSEIRISIHSRNPKARAPASAGRWMQFKLEPDAEQAPLDIGEIAFDKEDFDFQPLTALPPPTVQTFFKLDIPVPLAASTWSVSGFGGAFFERQPLTDGRIVGEILGFPEKPMMFQVVTAEGAILYSPPVLTPNNPKEVVTTPLTFKPGVPVKGRIQDLPATEDGTGWVIAHVIAKPDAALNEVFKGPQPVINWTVWAPVAPDGSFQFSGLPHGQVTLAGLGKGWVTKFSYATGGDSRIHLDGSSDHRDVTLQTQPCLDKSVRLLTADGRPAAGAKVEASFFGTDNIHLTAALGSRSRHTANPEKYAVFQKNGWLGQHAVADQDGRVTLINQPPGETTYAVTWTDPATGTEMRDRVKLKIDSTELADVTLTGKQP